MSLIYFYNFIENSFERVCAPLENSIQMDDCKDAQKLSNWLFFLVTGISGNVQ
jgi:hypothetical protein